MSDHAYVSAARDGSKSVIVPCAVRLLPLKMSSQCYFLRKYIQCTIINNRVYNTCRYTYIYNQKCTVFIRSTENAKSTLKLSLSSYSINCRLCSWCLIYRISDKPIVIDK